MPALPLPAAPSLIGVDFSSSPSRRKPIVLTSGHLQGAALRLDGWQRFDSLAAFSDWLARPGAWVGGFDLPFGLPRELVAQLGWPVDWAACMDQYASLSRSEIRDTFAAFCAARPAGGKFAHRACDARSGASPSMKWVNPPVAYMLHAGVPLLRAAGLQLPAHQSVQQPAQQPDQPDQPPNLLPNPQAAAAAPAGRIALEAYPGLLARELIGNRSYKADDKARQTPERLIARKDIIDALEQGRSRLGLRLRLSTAQREQLADEASADTLDAVLCLLQAAWASGQPRWGLPADVDPLEGWILSA